MSADLLLEIGCEEIPAKFVTRALAELPEMMAARLTEARLSHAGVSVLGTPRRLAVIVRGLAARQVDLSEEVVGPPVSAAFGADGAPTKAGIGFAQKNGVDPAHLGKREVPGKKGLYAVAERHVVGQATPTLLPALLASVVSGISWPKSMRWGWGESTFVRPIQWIVALYGAEVVPFGWAELTSGRMSQGHRFLAPTALEISSASSYTEALRGAFVIVDPEARRDVVRGELSRIERETGLKVRPDEALIDEVVQLGEYPVGICGEFAREFLEVPEEVIVTAMRTHQRYFAMTDGDGKLAPRFVTLMATVVKDPKVVAAGNQRVLAARLADARFFFTEDQKKPLAEWGAKLESVVFQAKLGEAAKSMGEKVRRVGEIATAIAAHVGAAGGVCDAAVVQRAAALCKADLATGIVGEFPELQGVMGMHYARRQGAGEGVALAIAEHYLPKGQGSALPSTVEGAALALADRLDTLVGCFAVGLVPSGSADPFGLRRAALGILQILLLWGPGGERAVDSFPDLEALLSMAEHAYGPALNDGQRRGGRERLRTYFQARLQVLLTDEGLAPQDAQAVVTQDTVLRIPAARLRERAREVARVPEAARQVFKRIANILDDAEGKGLDVSGSVDPAAFVADAERNLWRKVEELDIAGVADSDDYGASFGKLRELGPTVAAFFDKGGVMVMDPDPKLRDNRLALLVRIRKPYQQIVDFRLLGGAA
ncbi:MAG TPA: glycine--tRNA ligase subunit beta [Kofleriaceae bacterium]|nr:glycine--tRNA ligase subunit beta [Kofleriaceae bacterium]